MISTAVLIGVSYATAPPDEARLVGLTYDTVTAEQRASTRRSWTQTDVLTSGGVLVLILAAYLYFHG